MKRLCKNIDITNWKTVLPWVLDCIMRHKSRHDFRTLLHRHGVSRKAYREGLVSHDYSSWFGPIESIAREACQRIYERDIDLPAPTVKTRYDPVSRKEREIGCECAMQQVYDFIAVNGSMPALMKRITPFQASSIKKRGQIYGMRIIRRWAMKAKATAEYGKRHKIRYATPMKYFVKLDIRKCFPNCRLEVFLDHFKRDCGNPDLLWLWEFLLSSHRVDENHQGFMIGAYTSQWAAQYMISFAYGYAMTLHKPGRRGNRPAKIVSHTMMFMDDTLLCGSSRRDLMKAVRELVQYMQDEFNLSIKDDWHIREFTEEGIDMMGFRIHPSGKVSIRGRTWVKIRRMLLRTCNQICFRQAKRLVSYKGFVKFSCSEYIKFRYKSDRIFRQASRVISELERIAI